MLHALAAAGSTRQVFWLHGARDRQHHPFAAEVRRLMPVLLHGRSYICYSRPGADDTISDDFDATGHLSRTVFEKVGIPREADVYVCGPTRFMTEMKEALATVGKAFAEKTDAVAGLQAWQDASVKYAKDQGFTVS